MFGGKNYQKWNNKMGKEIKSEIVKFFLLEFFDEFLLLYINELFVNFDGYLFFEQLYDLVFVVQDEFDRISVFINYVILNMLIVNVWEEMRICLMIKVIVMNLFLRFKREKRVKVMRISI